MKRYEVLAHQPLSVSIDTDVVQPFRLYLDSERPLVALRSLHPDRRDRMNIGGTRIWVTFDADVADLVQALQQGMLIAEDVMAGLAVTGTIPFVPCLPVQIVESDSGMSERRFVCFAMTEVRHWDVPISEKDVTLVQRAALHWRGLDAGGRIRRATRRYAEALGEHDPLSSFLSAYMGLEALEKPLANELGIPPGSEVVKGSCVKCGAEYERRRTVLAGVRAFIRGELHRGKAENGERDWKELSDLRTQLTHGLSDPNKIEGEAHRLLPAAMHYLHDACVHLGHAHELESAAYRLVRTPPLRFLLMGKTKNVPGDPLQPILDVVATSWEEHGEYGFVPQFAITNRAGDGVEYQARRLGKPLASATEADLLEMRVQDMTAPDEPPMST